MVRLRPGSDPTAPLVITGGPRHGHLQGFDLHANVAVQADQREPLERLCRYGLRPPVARDAVELTPEGKVLPLRRAFALDILACPAFAEALAG